MGARHIYQGTPAEMIRQMAEDILHVMQEAGVGWSGMHALAMIQIVVSMAHVVNKQAIGAMPSFEIMLTMLTRGLSQTPFSDDEAIKMNNEFCHIIETSGGSKISSKGSKTEGPIVMGPSLGVH